MASVLAGALFDLAARINGAPTILSAWGSYMSAAREAGLTCGMACFFLSHKSIGETTFASSCPSGWMQNYVQQGYQDVDPRVPMAAEAITSFTWQLSDWDGVLKGKQLAWRSDNEAAGSLGGMIVPDHRSHPLKIIALCGNPGTVDAQDQKVLYYTGLEMLDRMQALGLTPEPEEPVTLSGRERECLQWIAAGKSDWEVGTILSISGKTVGTHADRAKQKLKVITRAQVIVAAMRRGLIT